MKARQVKPVGFAGRWVGPGQPLFIIAEAGVNHNGNLSLAFNLVEAAVLAGADAVKFQTFKAARLATPKAPKAPYQKKTVPRETHLEMLRKLELSEDHHRRLAEHCRRKRILFMSSPFDEGSVDFLETLKVPAYKVPSGELTNIPFLVYIARKGKPMIISTGMATLEEVRQAVKIIRASGDPPLVLLHCVSLYPAPPSLANLRAMDSMARSFNVPVGFSDHTEGSLVALAATALGACVIEKHLTLDKFLPGPDHRSSMDANEFKSMVRDLRIVQSSLGDGHKGPVLGELETAVVARKSLVAASDILLGATLTSSMVSTMRAGAGLSPTQYRELEGKRSLCFIPIGTPLQRGMFR